jgi:hypothetical protein
MPYNVPEEEKPAFNQKVKSSLELLTGDVSRTLGQLKVLQPETLVEAYERPVDQQEALPPQEGVAPIVSEYQQPVGGDIMSVTPYQQAVTNASLAETDSLRNETGAIMDSPIEVFSKPLDRNKIKLLGLADDEMKPTEKGKLFYNLQEAGMFDDTGVITEKGAAYLTPINELGKPENLKAFQTLWDDKVIRPSASFGEITENTAKFLGDAVVGGAEGIALGAESVWKNSQTWSSLFGKTDNRPQALRDKLTANNLGLIEGAVENLSGWAGMADVGAAWIGKKLYDVLPAGMEEEAEQAMYAARQRQWQTQQDIANLDAGEIAEAVLGIDNAVKEAEDAKSRMGKDAFNEKYKQAGAFSQLAADPTNVIPASIAVKAARMAPLANRLSITAQKRMTQIAAQDLAIAQGRTAIEAANSVLKKEAATVGIANRLGADISSRAGANPELVARANQASQVAGRITQSADQIRATLPAVSAELEGLVAKRNSLATRIPEAYAQKVLQTMEAGRQVRSMPAKAIGATLERVGDTLSRTDDAVTNFLKERGLDQMYTAAVGAAGVVGLAGSPIIGAVATGAAALKAGNMLSNYGKLFRYVGKEMENVRGQIPFWKRVGAHTAPNSLGRGIAHTFNMLDLGGVTSDVLRRTGRGIAAAAPTDLMFEYLSDGADMRPETLYQAAAESLVIGGSFAAAGGAFMGTERRMRELSTGDLLNFRRDMTDPRQKALFDSVPSGIRRAIATYSIANPTLNYQFKDSGASQYDPNTNTATINVKSTNPIKALIAHETLHHTIIKNNMESGISALFLGDMKQNTVGGLFRSRDGKLDPNFEAFKDAYYKRLGVAEMSNAERDAIYPLDKVAVEYFIEKHSDQYSAMAESGELGGIAASGAVKRKLGSILETVLPRIPVLKDLHFKSGGMIDKDGSWVTGNGILDAEGIKTDPITNKMFRDMNRRSAGLATGQFEPLISDKADSGAQIILNPSDSIDSELLHPLVKTDDSGRPVLENGKPVALDKATELERALAGLTALEVMRRKRSENYAPEKGEAYVDSEGEFQTGWLSDDVVSEMFARNRFNPEQKRIIREVNKLVRKGTGDRVVMINFPATTRNKANKVIYKPQGATLRDTVPVAMTISKDGNLLFGLMSVTKLNENISKRSQSKRGKKLYSGNVDLILQDTQAMMDYHKSGVDSIGYFSEKYGAVEADERKKFINTMFGLLNQKEQAVLNPMLLEDGVKSRDNVYRTYRADRVSKAVPMLPQDYPAMPFSYEATSQVKMPEQVRQMPEKLDSDYMKAVEIGDVETQQRMVDEAAKAAGYVTGRAFHSTKNPRQITQFVTTARDSLGAHFGLTRRQAIGPMGRNRKVGNGVSLYEVYLNAKKPIRLEDKGTWSSDRVVPQINDQLKSSLPVTSSRSEIVSFLRKNGYDSVIYENRFEGKEGDEAIIVFDPSQIKSANPITRDSSGNVIPISNRFNLKSEDIRYMPEQKEIEKRVASEQDQDKKAQTNANQPTTIQAQPSGTSVSGSEATGEGLRQQGGLPRSVEQLQSQDRTSDQGIPLVGLPATVNVTGIGKYTFGPNIVARNTAAEYARSVGIDYNPPKTYAKVNAERATRIADEYEKMAHNPNDPKVKESYDAMIKETLDQWEVIKKTGLKVEPIMAGSKDPYAASPRLALIDVQDNNHLWFFPTESGFGGTESASIDISNNPLMQPTGEILNGHKMLANDVLRIVHDYFGHIKEGVGFRADGEENAWRSHAAMYSDKARPAMTAETRGQNSWVNFGPFSEFNKTASGAETQYAPQKTGLLPDWVMIEGASDIPFSSNPVPIDDKFLSLTDSGKQMLTGGSNDVKSGSILGTFRFMPESENERIMEGFPVDESIKKKMEGKVGFAFASDWSDSNRLYRTRNGRPIDILMGGVGYSYHPDIIGKGAWAGSFSNLTSRVLKKINQTDGIGLVVAGGRDSTISSRSFSLAFMEELRDDLINKTISRPVLNNIIRNSAERILGRKDIKSFADYDKLLHVENNAGGLTFEERFFMIKAIGSQENKKAFGLLNWNDVLKKYEMQNGKFEAGQIMSVVQFKKDAPLARASDIGAKEHKSYEAVIQGRPLGMLTEKVMIGDFFKDFFASEGTQPASYTRKVQTKMPSFKYGEGSAVFPKSSAESISSVAKMK